MPTTVRLAPVGAGKTEFALQRLVQTLAGDKPFARIWVLLATKRQETAFRQRLVDLQDQQKRVFFNIEFFNFYELNLRILNLAGKPPRRIHQAARLGILRIILSRLQRDKLLTVFEEIAPTPGFLEVLADFIYELKQNRVDPEIYTRAARSQKDRELALIYDAYQTAVQDHRLVDREGEGWLALEAIEQHDHLGRDIDLLLVDGYDQFTPVQAQVLARLSQRVGAVEVMLTTIPGREEDFGRRFHRARQRLTEHHAAFGAAIRDEMLPQRLETRHLELQHLGHFIFQQQPEPRASEQRIQLIEAPDPAQEVAAVLRRVKHLLLHGERPESILIAIRDWARYESHFVHLRQRYNLPLLLHDGTSLDQNPAIAMLLRLLELAPDFRRRDLLDVLRSPYIQAQGLDGEQIDQLDRISRQMQLVSGSKEDWLYAIDLSSQAYIDEDGEELNPLISEIEADTLSLSLEAFMDFVTPRATNNINDYVAWLDMLIGQDTSADPDEEEYSIEDVGRYTLNITGAIQQAIHTPETILVRDIAALNGLKDILRGMLRTQELLKATVGTEATTQWNHLYGDVKAAVRNASDSVRNPSRTGRVLVTTAADARGLPHEHVFILGLSEGVFPLELSEDPLYLDQERKQLSERSVLLETQAERADDDGLFYELISLPRQTLTLSRPTVQDGKRWIESHLWRAVNHVYDDLLLEHIRVGEVVPIPQVASVDEAMLAVANHLSNANADQAVANGLRRWLVNQHTGWSSVELGRMIEMQRLSRLPYNRYSGKLEHPDLIAIAADDLSSRRKWSATQLNEYGVCGFRFFAGRLLKLETLDEPEMGPDVMQLGSINHKILEETYQQLADDSIPLYVADPEENDENLNEALDILRQVADEIFTDAPKTFGFRETAYWQHEQAMLLRRLEAIIRLDFSANSPLHGFGSPRIPLMQEAAFGFRNSPNVEMPLSDDVGSIKLRGKIDRMDLVGDQAVIVDYKTGSKKIPVSEMIAGRNFQMMVYLAAADAILESEGFEGEVAGGLFWHIRDQKAGGKMRMDDPDSQEAMEAARDHLAQNIRAGRRGDFAVHPNKLDSGRCVSYCEFHQLCRVSIMNRRK